MAGTTKYRIERAVNRHVLNPVALRLSRLGVATALLSELETTGRTTGLVRRVPVTASFDDTGAWVISQHGTRSGWGANLTADPTVRIRQGDTWRTGTAVFLPDDDVRRRARSFATTPAFAPLMAAGFRALQTTPITVRITFTD